MATDKIEGYVVKTKKYKDKDVLLTIISSTGIKTIYGRGYKNIRSKYHALNNFLIKVEILGLDKKYFKVQDYDILNYFDPTKYKLESLEYIYKIVGMILRGYNLKYTKQFYELLDGILKNYNDKTAKMAYYYVMCQVLRLNNININFKTCNICFKDSNIKTLSLMDGGLICSDCYMGQKQIKASDIKTLNYYLNTTFENSLKYQMSDNIAMEIKDLMLESLGIY